MKMVKVCLKVMKKQLNGIASLLIKEMLMLKII